MLTILAGGNFFFLHFPLREQATAPHTIATMDKSCCQQLGISILSTQPFPFGTLHCSTRGFLSKTKGISAFEVQVKTMSSNDFSSRDGRVDLATGKAILCFSLKNIRKYQEQGSIAGNNFLHTYPFANNSPP